MLFYHKNDKNSLLLGLNFLRPFELCGKKKMKKKTRIYSFHYVVSYKTKNTNKPNISFPLKTQQPQANKLS